MDGATVLDGIPLPWVTNGGAVALLAFVFLLVMTGRLVPKATVDKLERDRDHHRAASEKKDETLNTLVDQNKHLLEGMRVVTTVVQEIQRGARL